MKITSLPYSIVYHILKQIDKRSIPQYKAMMLISLNQFFYCSFLLDLFYLKIYPINENYPIFLGLTIFTLNYFRFLHKGRYHKLICTQEEIKSEILRVILVSIMVISFLLGIGLYLYTGTLVRNT